jgi:hypothetical protein
MNAMRAISHRRSRAPKQEDRSCDSDAGSS